MKMQDRIRIFRERFAGRQDVYGKEHLGKKANGETFKSYYPVCLNFWTAACHIKNRTGTPCSMCDNQKYDAVSDSVIAKHVMGEEAHIYYMLLTDGSINFGAIDFDYKKGKEQVGYTFEDVARTSQALKELGIPHGIARSTGEGFHLYIFFSSPCQANKFRAVILHVFERAGFMEQMRLGIRAIPEVFPKQSNGADGIGNGIKPPMVESRWPNERNGFVTDSNVFISPDDQWAYLNSIPRETPEHIDKIIAEQEITVHEDNPARISKGGAYTSYLPGHQRASGKWQPPLMGSMEKVMEGCAAFKKLSDAKLKKGEKPSHDEGFALFHVGMSVADGMKWFEKNVPGWGQTEKDKHQLQYSVARNYAPHSCKKMQEQGICSPGTKCFEKQAPLDLVHGQYVRKTDIPYEQWPEPSPVRYAYGRGDDFLKKLQDEALALKDEKDAHVQEEKLKALAQRAQVFDNKQQNALKEFIKKNKIYKVGETTKIFNAAANEHIKDNHERLGGRDDTVKVNEFLYFKAKPYGYIENRRSKNTEVPYQLCACDINITEKRVYQDDGAVVGTFYYGKVVADDIEKSFTIETPKWNDNNEFMKYFGNILGPKFNVLKQDIDKIRQAAMGFSDKKGIAKVTCLMTQGWYNDSYIMPSVIVDKDGIRENKEQVMDLSSRQFARPLDFKLLSDAEFREVLLHINKVLLSTWPRPWTIFALTYTFLPMLMKPLGLDKRPALFFEGLTGSGKSALIHLMQYFWGDFKKLINLESTGKGLVDIAYDFKDACMAFDDYKSASYHQKFALEMCIHDSYDGSLRGKLSRAGQQLKAKGSRGIMLLTGEFFLTADAAKVARCIIIETHKQKMNVTKADFNRCWQVSGLYRGITPRFLHWVLNQDLNAARNNYLEVQNLLAEKGGDRQNSARISDNLAVSYIVWKLFVEFMVQSGVADHNEQKVLLDEHWKNIEEAQQTMLNRCEEEQDGEVFLRMLKQLIETKEVSIDGLPGYSFERKQIIGFVNSYTPKGIIYLHPTITLNEVRRHSKDSLIKGTERSIARQLVDINAVLPTEVKNQVSHQVRHGDKRPFVWSAKATAIGIYRSEIESVRPKQEPLIPAPEVNSEGMI